MITNISIKAQRSVFYNSKGQFLLDTTLSISKEQYKTWAHAEFNIITLLSNIKYPIICLENNVKPKGVIIASFVCDSNDIKEIKVLNDTSGYGISVINGLKELGKPIADGLRKTALSVTSEKKYMGKYYISISFMLIDFYEQLKIQKAVPIIRGTIPVWDTWKN